MNFLLRSSFTQHQQQQQQQVLHEHQPDLPDAEQEIQGSSLTSVALREEAQQISSAPDPKQDMRTRMPVQGHTDVSSNEGSVLVPERDLPEDWSSAPDLTQLGRLDRDFVFPGEQINILVTVSSHDVSVPEIITPFKVAAAINKNSLLKANDSNSSEGETNQNRNGELEENAGLVARETLREEGDKRRSVQLLESFRNSHFYVRIEGGDDVKTDGQEPDNVLPVAMETDGFDPVTAGGIARRAVNCVALGNGDIVVMLQVTVAAQSNAEDAVLEVLQYEQHRSPLSASRDIPRDLDPAQDLLHWLLPLDRNSFASQPAVPSTVASTIASSAQRLSFGGSNSTLFSFGHLRSSSQGALPPVALSASTAPTPPYPPSALNTAPGEWNRLYPERDAGSNEVGSEGLLSFRGVPLEPQRFSAHCGLEGLYVPGKRWYRKISIVQPLAVSSYFAGCNTEDLICVLIENVLPSHLHGVIIYIDSISIICQAAGSNSSPPQTIPIACVESGEHEKLPDLPLRTGEQHSFILRPTNSLLKSDTKSVNAFRQGKDSSEAGNYAVLVSCHCSHTQSRFYVKHSLKWKPRPARDLLVSVSLEHSQPTTVTNEALPQLKSQVVTVQATNLTGKDLDLTLLAPSSLACSPVSMVSLPSAANKSRLGSSRSFREAKGPQGTPKETKKKSSRSMSMPPGRERQQETDREQDKDKERAESPPKTFRERKPSAADLIAENSPARTHLWLQSTVPLGCVPAHSTTVVKCDLLPLTDGIIALDTLHLATKDRGKLFIPESALQIHSVSGIEDVSRAQ